MKYFIVVMLFLVSLGFSQTVINAIPAPANASGLCWANNALWCGAYGTQGDTIYKVNPTTGAVMKRMRWRTSADCYGLAFDTINGGSLWVSDHSAGDSVFLIDTISGGRIRSFKANKTYMADLANDGQALWHCCYYSPDGRAYYIRKDNGLLIDSINIPSIPQPWGATWDGNYLWVCNDGNYGGFHRIYKINTNTHQIVDSFASPGNRPMGIAWDGNYLWVIAIGTSPTGRVAYQIDLGGSGTPHIQITPTTYNFGNVIFPNTANFSLNIANTGTATLHIDTMFSNNSAFYNPYLVLPCTLAAGTNFNVQINFTPMAFQLYTGRIGIVSDDPVVETVYVNLRGQGVYSSPTLVPSETLHNFSDVRMGCVKDWYLRIVNRGYPQLMIDTIVFTNFNFFVGRMQFPILLNCLETTYVQIITRPNNSGPYSGNLQMYNNGTPNPMNLHLLAIGSTGIPVGGQMLWDYDYPDNVVCVAPIADINNDSILDVAAECYGTNMYGEKHLRTFWANSAGSGVSRWAIGDTSFTGSWGDDCLIAGADYNNDGVRDILLGTAWGDRSVYAINARTGQIIWQYDTHTYDGEGGWVYSVKPMPDVTGDSIGDVICGVGGNELPGGGPRCVYCLNGATGNVVWQCRVQDGIGSVDWTPDINGDYVPDVLAGAWGNSLDKKVYCISGLNGSVLWSHQCTQDVQSVITIPDINGDFKREVICGDWSGTVKCLSGINGSPLWTTSVGGWVVKLVAIPNLVSLNRPGIAVANVSGVTTFRVLDCTNGNVMWSYPIGGNIWTADAISDLNNDGKQEVITGNQAGMVYCFNGANGTPLWSYNAGRLIYSIRAINDISFDGNQDVLVGTQASSSTNVASLIAICSGSYTGAVAEQQGQLKGKVSVFPHISRTGFNISWDNLAVDKISVFDAMGRLIKDYDKPSRSITQIIWNAKDKNGKAVSHGIYFVKIEAKDFSEITKVIVVE